MALATMEPTLKYRPCWFENLTFFRNPDEEHCLVGSLTGVVASQTVTEAFKGPLKANRNRLKSAKAEGGLTARQTSRAGAKAGFSDPVVLNGRAIAKRIKGTPGITG